MKRTSRVVLGICLLSFALSCAANARPAAGEVPLTFHPRISEDALEPGVAPLWPTTFGVPFPQGALRDKARLRLMSEADEEIPVQAQITGTWPDGSVRWVLVDAQVPLGAEPAAYRLEWGEGVAATAGPRHIVRVTGTDAAVALDTGVFRLALSKQDMSVFLFAESLTAAGTWTPVFPAGEGGEIVVEDQDGKRHLGSLAPPPEVTVEEAGPLRATVKIEGWTQAEDGAKLGRHIVRVQAFAGMRWVRVYHTFVKTADSEEVQYRNISLHVPFQGRAYRFAGAGMDAPGESDAGDYILQHKHDEFVRVADGERAYAGERAAGTVSVSGGATGYSATRRHFREMFPSEFEVRPERLKLHFWPRHGRPPEHLGENMTMENLGHLWWVHEGQNLDFRAPEEAYQFSHITPNKFRGLAAANAMGVARTLEYQLDFHGEEAPLPAAETFRANPLMVVAPDWLAASDAFWDIAARSEHYAEVEDALEETLLFLPAMYERIGDYGLWNYGAYHQTYHPTLESAWLHRIWKGFHHGGPRWPWLNFARSGNPEVFDFAEIHSRHLMDVSVCNWEDPAYNERYWDDGRWWGGNTRLKFLGGLCRYKGIVHWHAGMRMFYNAQVDFALWHYYMTGYRRAWDVAMNMGEFLLRIDDAGHFFTQPDNIDPDAFPGAGEGFPPTFQMRGGMGRGAMAVTLYRATRDERYRDLAVRQMQRFAKYADEDPDNAGVDHIYYAPFVERYWEVLGDEEIEPYIVRWARKRLEEGITWTGRDPHYNMMALGYRLTGDEAFLRFGLAQARELLHNRCANAAPILEGVMMSSFAGQVGYAAQQWGHFVAALDEHEAATGERLLIPDEPSPLPLTAPIWTTPFGDDGPGRSPDGQRFVFHLRKEPGQAVRIPFSFRVQGAEEVYIEATPPGADEGDATAVPVENGRAAYEFALPPDAPPGDYRLLFQGDDGRARLMGDWPLPGDYGKIVLETPFWMRGRAGGFWFQPTRPEDGGEGSIRFTTRIRNRYFSTHSIFRPDGQLHLRQTEQGHVNGPLNIPLAIPAEHQNQLWLYRVNTFTRSDGVFLTGDVLPVVAFERERFFVPESIR